MKPAVSWSRLVAANCTPSVASPWRRDSDRFSFCSSRPALSRQPPSCVRDHDAAEVGRTTGVRERELAAIKLVGPCFHCEALAGQVGGRGLDDIDRAMHRTRAVHDAGGTAQDFDRAGLLAVHLEQLVHVAEARGADRDAVLQEQEHAARARARQHRRADRRQAFLPAVALDHRARRAIHDLRVMRRADERDVVARHDRDAAGKLAQLLLGARGRNDDFFEAIAIRCERITSAITKATNGAGSGASWRWLQVCHREARTVFSVEKSSLWQRESHHVVALLGVEAAVTAGCDDDELSAVHLVAHRCRLAARGQPAFPELAAGVDVEGAQVIVHRGADERESARP